jgi:hypothetical protein
MSDIFLSYKGEDLARAKTIAEVFEAKGWSVWWDRKILPGKTFAQVIETELNAAKCVVVLWSKESVKSEWVKNEADEGFRRHILVPVLIDNVKIPFEFRRIQAANLVDWQGTLPHRDFDLLIESVANILDSSLNVKVEEKEAKNLLIKALEFIRKDQLDLADAELQRLDNISKDLSTYIRLRILYDRACVYSLRAEKFLKESVEQGQSIDRALQYLEKWLILGMDGAWQDSAQLPQNEIYRMCSDSDLRYVLSERRDSIIRMIPEDLQSAIPKQLPPKSTTMGGGSGGCVPAHTPIQTFGGYIFVEDLRAGIQIMSIESQLSSGPIQTRVIQMNTSREPTCIRLNQQFVFTPTQPLYGGPDGWIRAIDLTIGMWILDSKLNRIYITHVEHIKGYFEVYNLMTDHPSHNYVAYELVCHNKMA